jgi:hypothetical protein
MNQVFALVHRNVLERRGTIKITIFSVCLTALTLWQIQGTLSIAIPLANNRSTGPEGTMGPSEFFYEKERVRSDTQRHCGRVG